MPTIVSSLQDILGQRVVAVLAGVSDAKAVSKWARGGRSPHPETDQRLRNAYQIVQLLLERESPETVRAWFVGMNPDLDDQAPALMLGKDPIGVLQAARTFLAHG
jgi:transcriptional regulator with XRE-family HTH domain